MKKVFSLILAVAMVMSLASVAFATTGGFITPWDSKESSSSVKALPVKSYSAEKMYLYDKTSHVFTKVSTDNIEFDKTIYIPIFVSDSKTIATQDKSVSSLKLTWTPQIGGSFVESVSIVKKYGAVDDGLSYVKVVNNKTEVHDCDKETFFNGYYIAIDTCGSSTSVEYVTGQIFLTGKSGDNNKLKDEAVFVDFKLAWESKETTGTTGTFSWTPKVKTTYVLKQTSATDVEIKFEKDVKFTVELVPGEKEVLKYTVKADKPTEDANEEAGISFYNFNGATFKRSGDLFFEQDLEEEDAYLYEIMADGSLKNLSATYDEEEGGFMLKVKKLGFYCISDLPLVDAEGTVAAVAGAVNPTTGAIA